ncbi:MAG: hypothetical protein ABSC92_02940 [Rhizomicrobium sp.]
MSLSGNYQLAKDITDCGTNFTPIGGGGAPFTGVLDGNGFAIGPFTISSSAAAVGLFGYANGRVSNVRLVGVNLSCTAACIVGALAAENEGAIVNSSVSGSITLSSSSSVGGGIVGENDGEIYFSSAHVTISGANDNGGALGGLAASNFGIIGQSYATGNVEAGGGIAGGLVGIVLSDPDSARVSQSYATGNVTMLSSGYVGGLIGFMEETGGTTLVVNQSYAAGNVEAGDGSYVGGFVGWQDSGNIGQSFALGSVSAGANGFAGGFGGLSGGPVATVDQSFSVGAVSAGSNTPVGGFFGSESGSVTNSYWDTQTSGTTIGVGDGSSLGITGLLTSQMQDGSLDHEAGFVPTVWEPMLTKAVQPAAGYFPQLWALSFPIKSFPLAGQAPYGSAKSNPLGAQVITFFDHSLRTSAQSGINGNPLTAALYGASCDGAVLAFSGQLGLEQYGQDTATCDEAGYEQDDNGDKFVINGINYVGDSADKKEGYTPTQYLNYEGHPGIDYGAKYMPVYAAVSGVLFYPYQVIGTGQGKTKYDTYCRFHTLSEIPDSAAAYRIYYLHLRTHPNGLGLPGFPPDPPCSVNRYNTPGQQQSFTPALGCYTLNGQPYTATTLPLPSGVHANAGCEIAISGDAGVPGAPHLHFEIQQIVPSAAISKTVASVIKYFQCWNENNQYASKTSSYCLPADPYGWAGPSGSCDPSQWPPNGNVVTDEWACLSGNEANRFWAQ